MAPFVNFPSKPLILMVYAATAALYGAILIFGDDWLSPVLPSGEGQIGRPHVARIIIKFNALVLVIHVVEFAVKYRVLKKDSTHSISHHFIQTMLFGMFHWKHIENRQRFAWTPLKTISEQPVRASKPTKGE